MQALLPDLFPALPEEIEAAKNQSAFNTEHLACQLSRAAGLLGGHYFKEKEDDDDHLEKTVRGLWYFAHISLCYGKNVHSLEDDLAATMTAKVFQKARWKPISSGLEYESQTRTEVAQHLRIACIGLAMLLKPESVILNPLRLEGAEPHARAVDTLQANRLLESHAQNHALLYDALRQLAQVPDEAARLEAAREVLTQSVGMFWTLESVELAQQKEDLLEELQIEPTV